MVDQAVVLIDGDCVLCSGFANFVVARAPPNLFFETQQSERGGELLEATGMPIDLSTVVLIERADGGTHGYTKSTAVLRVMKMLSFPWPLLYIFIIIPAFIRDFAYNAVANARYRMFGKNEACGLPDKVTRQRLTRWFEE